MTTPKNVQVTASSRGISEAMMELEDAFKLADPDDSWVDKAKCHAGDGIKWFPDQGERMQTKIAKEYCFDCQVKAECLSYAMKNEIIHGIWGGKSAYERKIIFKSRKYNAKMGL
jgi:WhiB family redox-sensing transcriptional regulator